MEKTIYDRDEDGIMSMVLLRSLDDPHHDTLETKFLWRFGPGVGDTL